MQLNYFIVPITHTGQVGWKINKPVFEIIKECYDKKLNFGDLPGMEIEKPLKEDCIRIVPPKIAYKIVYNFKSKDEIKAVAESESENSEDGEDGLLEEVEQIDSGVLEDLPVKKDKENGNGNGKVKGKGKGKNSKEVVPEVVEEPDPLIPRFDEKYYKDLCRRTDMKNSALHSLRCDLQLKFWVAEKFQDEIFYYPYNLDFRGRAYPVPPNLNHLGIL